MFNAWECNDMSTTADGPEARLADLLESYSRSDEHTNTRIVRDRIVIPSGFIFLRVEFDAVIEDGFWQDFTVAEIQLFSTSRGALDGTVTADTTDFLTDDKSLENFPESARMEIEGAIEDKRHRHNETRAKRGMWGMSRPMLDEVGV